MPHERGPLIARLDGHRILSAAAVGVVAAGALLAGAASATARPALAGVAWSVTPRATLARPTPPAVQPEHGRSFIPVQGDWEGTADGFAASFNLIVDAVRQQRAGVPGTGSRTSSCSDPWPARRTRRTTGSRS